MSAGSSCPSWKPYAVTVLVLALIWCGLIVVMSSPMVNDVQTEELESMVIGTIGRGIGLIAVVAAVAYAGHWAVKGVRAGDEGSKILPVLVMGTPVETYNDEAGRRIWSLELRGVGATPGPKELSRAWQCIQRTRDNFSSFYTQSAEGYPVSSVGWAESLELGTGYSFRMAANGSVAYWPIPVFAVEPPRHENAARDRAAAMIATGKQKGQLGVTQFLWQADANTEHAQGMIEQLFAFFDENAEVPQALIASRDGDTARRYLQDRRIPNPPAELRVPTVLTNTAALLVARGDRVDRYLRPFAPEDKEDNQNKQTDLGKLWAHFWETDSKSIHAFMAEQTGDKAGNTPVGTLQSAEWQAALPELWATIDNRGPGQFEPTPWLPVRWVKHQVDEFDRAPKLGHLHRPVKVALRDEQGRPLKAALQVKAMTAGWERALATLPTGDKPVRVFYDSTDNMDATIALNNALHALNADGDGLDLGNVDEGYDIGRRLWNLGVGSALTQIGLAAIASYKEGGVTAVMYAGDEGSVSIQMVRPPSEEEKAHNVNYGQDPFMWGS